jgi:hypothetical protein
MDLDVVPAQVLVKKARPLLSWPGLTSLAPLPDELREMIGEGDVFAIDSPSGYGVPQLIERICEAAVALPRFHHKWPGSYIRARNDVLALRDKGAKR